MATPNKTRAPEPFTPRIPFPVGKTVSPEAFRNWLRAEVIERGGQVKAAKQLRIAQTMLSQILRGITMPGHHTAAKLGVRRVDRKPVFWRDR